MVFKGELAVELCTEDIEVGTSVNGNPRQDQGFTFLDLTAALVLLELSIKLQ